MVITNMYQINYQPPNTKETKNQMQKMNKEQQKIFDIIMHSKR